jgi:hypothetical protein
MSELAQEIIREQGRLASERSGYDGVWQQIAERCAPELALFNSTFSPGHARTDKQFDSTASMAATSFAAALMGMIVPREKVWHGLRSGVEDLDRRPRVKAYFEAVRDALFYHRYSPRSNFANQFHATMLSMGLFGPGGLWVDEVVGRGQMVYRNVPCHELWIEEDEHGRVSTVYRRAKLAAALWEKRWPGAVNLKSVREAIAAKQGHRELEFIQCIRPRADRDPEAWDARGMAMESLVVSIADKEVVRQGGFHSMPLLVGRFTALSTAKYGRPPAVQVLPDIKMTNEMQKTLLRAAHRAVSPPLLVHDDGVLTRVALKPDAVNVGGVSADGRPMVQPLQTGGQIGAGIEMVEMARKVVERAFLVPLFSILTDTPDRMTATEVLERSQEKGMLLNPAAGMIEAEILGPTIEREIDLLARMGRLPEMPAELVEAEGEYRITYDNPLQRAARSERSIGFLRTLEALTPLMTAAGPEGAAKIMAMFDIDAAVRGLAEDNGVPVSWMKDPEQRQTEQDDEAQAAGLMQLVQGAKVAGDAAKSLAEAQALAAAA